MKAAIHALFLANLLSPLSSAFAVQSAYVDLRTLACEANASPADSGSRFKLSELRTIPGTQTSLSHLPLLSEKPCDENTLDEVQRYAAQNSGYVLGVSTFESKDTSACSKWCTKDVEEKFTLTLFAGDRTLPNGESPQIVLSSVRKGTVSCPRPHCPF